MDRAATKEAMDMATPALDRETILQAVRTWSPEEQMTLAREILQQTGHVPLIDEPPEPPARGSWLGLVGLLATDKPPPTDEEVAQWLDEHRMEKYGR